MIGRIFRYPWGGSRYLKIVLIGGLLLYYERFIIVTGIFVMGYLIRVLRSTDEEQPPGFEDWRELVVHGVIAELIWFIYLIVIPGLIILLTAEGIVEQGQAIEVMVGFVFEPYTHLITFTEYLLEFTGFDTDVSAEIIALEPIIIFILMIYLFPAALQVFAEEGRIAAPFSPTRIRSTVKEPEYLYRWLPFVTLWVASIAVLSIPFYYGTEISRFLVSLFGVSIIENELAELFVVIAAFVSFYLLVSAYYTLGSAEQLGLWTSIKSFLPTHSLRSALRSVKPLPSISTILLGGLLLSTQLVIFVALIIGYLLRVLRSEVDGELPGFDRWWSLLIDGFRMIGVWVGYILWPVLILLAGQRVLLPRGVTVGSLRWANFIVGLLGVSIGPPIAYNLDRVIRDVLLGLDLATLSNNPYLIRDVTTVSPVTWMLFTITFVAVLYILPAAHYRVATNGENGSSILAGFDLRAVLSLVVRPKYTVNWFRGVFNWLLGSGPLIGWVVWRRHQVYTGGPSSTALTETGLVAMALPEGVSAELALPVPTVIGIISTTFLLVLSTACFYFLVRGYVSIRAGCERPAAG